MGFRLLVLDVHSVPRYDFESSDGFAVPIHRDCLSILQTVWGLDLRKVENLRHLQALYDTFRCLADKREKSDGRLAKRLFLKGVEEWCLVKNTDACEVAPTERDASISDYFQHLATSTKNRFLIPRYRAQPVSWLSQDRFSNLPLELVTLVLMHLPIAAIDNARKASPNLARLELGNWFWKRKLQIDAPWLYEFDELFKGSNNHLDWERLYCEVAEMKLELPVQGLVNRRRIWSKCEWLAVIYKRRLEESREMHSRLAGMNGPGVSGVSSDSQVMASPLGRLTWPSPAYVDTFTLYFDHELGRAEHGPRVLSVYWTRDGVLSGFGIAQNRDGQIQHEQRIGHQDRFAMRNDVEIRADNCMIGLIVTVRGKSGLYDVEHTRIVGLEILLLKGTIQLGERDGNKKRFDIAKNSVLVGLHAQISFDGELSTLCLLHSQTVPDCCQPIHRQCQDLIAHQSIGSRLWRNQVPPAGLELSPWELNSWHGKTSGFEVDFSSMEPLFFGCNGEELSNIVELAGDATIGAFEVRYSNREPRSIGPRPKDMKALSIDGRGGERIVAVDVSVESSSLVKKIIFTTNFKRCLVIGQTSSECGSLRLDPPDTSAEGLCGIYAVWHSTDRPPETIGLMLAAGAMGSLGDGGPYRLNPSKRLSWALLNGNRSPWGP